ncbi:MAG: hypothetical protein ACF8MJ_11420 [Phycisphaerales bacterium JB050]
MARGTACWRGIVATVLCAIAAWGGACTVTEVRPVTPGSPSRSTGSSSNAEPIEVPLDSSAVARVVNSRVVLATRALGDVPFDGQVLPVLSPDGRYLATQTGEAPDWESLLGLPGQSVSSRTRVEAYDLSASTPRRIRWTQELPSGCLLGRSADDSGFLIERIMPDATRRIGKVSWATGGVTWLTAEGDTAAAGTLGSVGSANVFATTLRTASDPRRRLRVRASGGVDTRDDPGISYHMPTGTSDPTLVLAVAQSTAGTDLVAIRVEDSSPLRSYVLARRPISAGSDPMIAYQALSSLQSPLPLSPVAEGDQPPGVLFFHPSAGRMAVLELATGAVTMLVDKSIAGAWHVRRSATGEAVWSVFLTSPQGLQHQTLVRRDRVLEAMPASRVSDEVWVARSTTDPVRPFILIGPSSRDPRSLTLVEMRPTDPPR